MDKISKNTETQQYSITYIISCLNKYGEVLFLFLIQILTFLINHLFISTNINFENNDKIIYVLASQVSGFCLTILFLICYGVISGRITVLD